VTALINVVGKDVVISQPGTWRYPGHVIDADAIYHRSLTGHAGGDPSRVRSVIVYRLRIDTLLVGLVIEDLRNNDLW
jgi:hypothetical protein